MCMFRGAGMQGLNYCLEMKEILGRRSLAVISWWVLDGHCYFWIRSLVSLEFPQITHSSAHILASAGICTSMNLPFGPRHIQFWPI